MPRIDMRDAFGTTYRIDSMDWGILQQWFDEWLPRVFPASMPDSYGAPLLTVWPLPEADGRTMDWAADTRYITEPFYIPRDPSKALATIAARREEIEKKVKELHGQRD
jgi:hypothetical protein